MDNLQEFSIPIKGLKTGIHEFDFQIEKSFFEQFEGSTIQDGDFEVHLKFDKRESFFELFFDFDGEILTDCDRCMTPIRLPFGGDAHLTVKLTLETLEEDAEVVYISPEESHFNVAQYIYEFIALAVPIFKTYDCENDDPRPCDFDILNRLNPDPSVSGSPKSEEVKKNPFGDLKNLFDNNN